MNEIRTPPAMYLGQNARWTLPAVLLWGWTGWNWFNTQEPV